MKSVTGTGTVRCAIYTRVSSDQGLDQDFNSLDAQYEAASAYIKSQAHAGWTLIRSRYDGGGYSGGSTDRPNLQQLLEDVRCRKIDVIVRLQGRPADQIAGRLRKLVELFDAYDVSFVSVTQQFNTTTSMGRLTLNMLLSFAQFEREVTSERIRNKIAAFKRRGLWVGGPLPLRYELKDGKLVVVEEEAERVRLIFRRYLEVGGINELVRDLRAKNICTRARQSGPVALAGLQRIRAGWLLRHSNTITLRASGCALLYRTSGDALRKYVLSLKENDMIICKAEIAGTSLRSIEIRPAVLLQG